MFVVKYNFYNILVANALVQLYFKVIMVVLLTE